MKRLFLASIAASAALFTACNKDNGPVWIPSDDESLTEISLRATGATKSAVNGTAFPQAQDMLVSVFRNPGVLSGSDVASNYMEGNHFAYDGESTSWKSTNGVKYYPPDGTLDFLAVSSAGLRNASNGIIPTAVWGESSNVAKKVVLTVPDNSAKFDDLMYAASNAQSRDESGTSMEFRHAMTCVIFVAKSEVAYNSVTNMGITLDGITLDGAKYSGTLTVQNPSAGGGSGDLSAAWSGLGDAKTHIAARVWNAANLGNNASETALSGLNLTTSSKSLDSYPFGEGYVILPPQDAVPFTVTYTIHNGFEADGVTKLNKQVQYQVTPTGTWGMAQKNLYSLDFSLSEILINPSVLDWDDGPHSGIPFPDPAAVASNGYGYVDLGLRSGGNKILFAKMNIGAVSEEEYGDYFAWGETSKRYTSIDGSNLVIGGIFTWNYTPYHTGGDNATGWTKYIPTERVSYWSGDGDPDNILTLETSDDVAHALWGGSWRMPDSSELEMLINSSLVNYEWTADYDGTGVAGLLVTGKGFFSSASLFLPAAGFCSGGSRWNVGTDGYYWSRSLFKSEPNDSLDLHLEVAHTFVSRYARSYGFNVRPVLVVPE